MSPKEPSVEKTTNLFNLGWRCVFDSHYSPDMNADAIPLFDLYPRLFQRHGRTIWCTAPGLAVLAAFRDMVSDRATPRQAAAAIGSVYSDNALVALIDALGTDDAAVAIRTTSEPELQSILGALAFAQTSHHKTDDTP